LPVAEQSAVQSDLPWQSRVQPAPLQPRLQVATSSQVKLHVSSSAQVRMQLSPTHGVQSGAHASASSPHAPSTDAIARGTPIRTAVIKVFIAHE
jgi:hypothetical protein